MKLFCAALILLLLSACGVDTGLQSSKQQPDRLLEVPEVHAYYKAAQDSQGRALVLGLVDGNRRERELVVSRFSSALVLDPAFGDQGHARVALPPDHQLGVVDLIVDAQGRIVASAIVFQRSPEVSVLNLNVEGWLVRFDERGQLDARFGNNGVARVPPSLLSPRTYFYDLLEVDGGYLVAGLNGAYYTHFLLRPDQAVDPFGLARTPPALAGGLFPPRVTREFGFVLKFDDAGQVDAGYGNMGVTELPRPGGLFTRLAPNVSGGVDVLHMELTDFFPHDLYLTRLDASGRFDETFGEQGTVLASAVVEDPGGGYQFVFPRQLRRAADQSLLVLGCHKQRIGAAEHAPSVPMIVQFSERGAEIGRQLYPEFLPNAADPMQSQCLAAGVVGADGRQRVLSFDHRTLGQFAVWELDPNGAVGVPWFLSFFAFDLLQLETGTLVVGGYMPGGVVSLLE